MAAIKIGLEIHGYLNVKGKLFCDCSLSEAPPNTNVCPICTGMPGSKPMAPNVQAVEKTLSVAGMLGCKINKKLLFQRKHYDWPDMPVGYQRTMSGSYSVPVGENGDFLGIGIEGVHLEEDPARWQPETGYVDYNRSGFPLVEIVTKPDFPSSSEVRDWLRKVMTLLSYVKAINPDSGVKSDVNVSIGPNFNRVEIKNVNSFRSIIRAIEYEIRRQTIETREGKKIKQETKAWNEDSGTTIFMRSKEQAMDYMFIPDPDLPVINLDKKTVSRIVSKLPEKPSAKAGRYVKELKIDEADAEVLSSDILLAELFEKASKEVDPVLAARWLRRELLRVLNYNKKPLLEFKSEEKQIIALIKLVENKKITDEVAGKLLEKLVEKPFDVDEYVKKERLEAVSDEKILKKYCMQAISENPQAVEDYKKGNQKALNFIVGSVMKKSKGKAVPGQVRQILKESIK